MAPGICVAHRRDLLHDSGSLAVAKDASLVANLVANPGIHGECRGVQRRRISNLLILLTLPRVRVPSAPPIFPF